MSGRHANSLFCDDIRQEVNGKLSFMGCYTGVMEVASFPLTLTQLCVFVRITSPIAKPFSKLVVRLLKDDTVIGEGKIPDDALAQENRSHAEKYPDPNASALHDRYIGLHVQFALSPFTAEGPCILKVRVETEDEELKGGGLFIKEKAAKL